MDNSPPRSSNLQNNIALAAIFHQMANCYRYLGNNERFRAIAYENVSKILHNMQQYIATSASDISTLDAIGGIGKGIAQKIIEYLQSGKIETFEQLKQQVPFELLELMEISGFGPATLRTLNQQLKIYKKEDLIQALKKNQLKNVKGFGDKKIEQIQRALKLYKQPTRMQLKEAEKIGTAILELIKTIPGVEKAVLAGSLRRKKATIGDIDIVLQAKYGHRKKIVDQLIHLPPIDRVLSKGITKASVLLKHSGIQVDIRLVNSLEFGATLLYFTGSKEHNIKLRSIAKNSGYKINEYGLFDIKTDKRLAGATEEEMYHLLHLQFIPPQLRVDKGEIEKACLSGKETIAPNKLKKNLLYAND